MKKTPRLVCLLACILFCLSLKNVNAQTINVAPKAAAPEVAVFTISGLNALPLSPDFGNQPTFRQAFVVLGDGNFFFHQGQLMAGKSYTFEHEYFMPASGSLIYNPWVMLVDRKTDDPPPGMPALPNPPGFQVDAPAQFGAAASGEPIILSANMNPALLDLSAGSCQRVAIQHSHYLADDEWSAFSLAFHPRGGGAAEPDPELGVLLFFYDSTKFQSAAMPIRPRYGNAQLNDAIRADQLVATNSLGFNKMVAYPFSSNIVKIDRVGGGDPAEELRFFYALQTADIDETVDSTMFMVMVATNSPFGCGPSNFPEDAFFANPFLAAASSNQKTITIGTQDYFYLDADTISVRNGQPKDPNTVQVTQIEDIGNGKFRVYFTLRFCNENPTPTHKAGIYLFDRSPGGLFSNFTSQAGLPGENLKGGFRFGSDVTATECVTGYQDCSALNFCDNCAASFCVGGYTLAVGLTDDCATFAFTAETTQAGLQALHTPGIIEGCVNFRETQCEFYCSVSEPLDSLKPIPFVRPVLPGDIGNGLCEQPCTICSIAGSYATLLLCALALLLVLICWLFFRRKR